ncbi:PepSY domain-containing protein [Sphingopyxis sp. PET50]|uniref:PepSY domain-containing protein n=1 Tax=Sphingopyxis sp. PET50 TaxID=2976533 RepID=UPI0021AEDC1E|nr:PepSY domain-containing protein [Sphingopyxis sp. PET50]
MHRLLIRWHMLVAAFLFPAILLYLVTGALYTWGAKGDYATTDYAVTLSAPLTDDKAALQAIVVRELAERGIAPPTGGASVKPVGDSFQLDWTGSRRDVTLEPGESATTAKLIVKDTGWHRFFVQLHKAKGGTPFKVYAVVLALGLFFLVTSGLIVALKMPQMRRGAIIGSVVGLAAFAGVAAVS